MANLSYYQRRRRTVRVLFWAPITATAAVLCFTTLNAAITAG